MTLLAGTHIHQLQDIRGSLKEPEKDKTETKHIQERSSTITQNSGKKKIFFDYMYSAPNEK